MTIELARQAQTDAGQAAGAREDALQAAGALDGVMGGLEGEEGGQGSSMALREQEHPLKARAFFNKQNVL